jgi:hypothetical protein
MPGVFRNIDPPSPHRPASVYAFGAGGGHTRWVESGWGVSSEDTRPMVGKVTSFVNG